MQITIVYGIMLSVRFQQATMDKHKTLAYETNEKRAFHRNMFVVIF